MQENKKTVGSTGDSKRKGPVAVAETGSKRRKVLSSQETRPYKTSRSSNPALVAQPVPLSDKDIFAGIQPLTPQKATECLQDPSQHDAGHDKGLISQNDMAVIQDSASGTRQDPFHVTSNQPTPTLPDLENGPNYTHDYQVESVNGWMSSLAMLTILNALVPHPTTYHVVEPLYTQPSKVYKSYRPCKDGDVQYIIIPLHDRDRRHWMISIASCVDGRVLVYDPDRLSDMAKWIEAVKSFLAVCQAGHPPKGWQRPLVAQTKGREADGATCAHRCIEWVICHIYGVPIGNYSIQTWVDSLRVVINCSSDLKTSTILDDVNSTGEQAYNIGAGIERALTECHLKESGTKALKSLASRIISARKTEDAHRRAVYTNKLAQLAVDFNDGIEKDTAAKLAAEAAGKLLKSIESPGVEALLRFSEQELERAQNALSSLTSQALKNIEQWQENITKVRSALTGIGVTVQANEPSEWQHLGDFDDAARSIFKSPNQTDKSKLHSRPVLANGGKSSGAHSIAEYKLHDEIYSDLFDEMEIASVNAFDNVLN